MQARALKQLLQYGLIGIANTMIHGIVFFLLLDLFTQAISNLFAFFAAVSFSFYMNAIFTFKERPTPVRFLKMVFFMAICSYGFGFMGDYCQLEPAVTIVIYFILNPFIGFIFTKFLVFKNF